MSGPGITQRIRRGMLTAAVVPSIVVAVVGVAGTLFVVRRANDGLIDDTLDATVLVVALVAAAVVLTAALAAYWSAVRLGSRLTLPLRELQAEANRLASAELPRMAASLHSTDGSGEMPIVDLIDIEADGEVAELADAFNALRVATIEVTAAQAMGRSRDLAGVLVNLGRRNQHLLHRQLQLIDALEATESDPDMLRNLFALDQMATRMRRNAESLLVLAGERVDRQSQVPMSIEDVLRAAASEVEDYHRVDQSSVEPAQVTPKAVSDLTHLLAELIENATGFSDPATRVRLLGRWEEHTNYTISVIDNGAGMSRRLLNEANSRIVESAVGRGSPTRHLGLFVVGRLAARHGIDARLVESAQTGTVAKVTLPPSCVLELTLPPRQLGLDALPTELDDPTGLFGPPPVHTSSAPISGQVPRIRIGDEPRTESERLPMAPSHRIGGGPDAEPAADADPAVTDEGVPIPPFQKRESQITGEVPVVQVDGPDPADEADPSTPSVSDEAPTVGVFGGEATSEDATDGEDLLAVTPRHPSSPSFQEADEATSPPHLEVVPDAEVSSADDTDDVEDAPEPSTDVEIEIDVDPVGPVDDPAEVDAAVDPVEIDEAGEVGEPVRVDDDRVTAEDGGTDDRAEQVRATLNSFRQGVAAAKEQADPVADDEEADAARPSTGETEHPDDEAASTIDEAAPTNDDAEPATDEAAPTNDDAEPATDEAAPTND
ncbi:MAG: ATP-binding protein, partial [Actinomycetota bacterium]